MKKLLLFALACCILPSMEAKLITKSVAYEHQGTQLEGYLAYDDARATAGQTPASSLSPNGGA